MKSRRALTLFEVVVAVGLLAVVLGVAVVILNDGLVRTHRQECNTRAAFLAQQRLEELMTRRTLAADQGSFEPPYQDFRWSLEVRPEEGLDFLALVVEGPSGSRFHLATRRRSLLQALWFTARRDGRCHIARVEEDGSAFQQFPEVEERQPAPSPDGELVAFVCNRLGQSRVYLRQADASGPAWPVDEQGGSTEVQAQPAWSADSQKLVFTVYAQGSASLRLWSRSSRHLEDLGGPSSQAGASFGPGATMVLVTSDPDGRPQIALRTGSTSKIITHEEGWCSSPSLSPDGRQVALMSNRDGQPEIYLVNSGGGQLRRLTRDPGYDTGPRFSADGQRLAFGSDRTGRPALYVVRLDTSQVRAVPLPEGVEARDVCWGP